MIVPSQPIGHQTRVEQERVLQSGVHAVPKCAIRALALHLYYRCRRRAHYHGDTAHTSAGTPHQHQLTHLTGTAHTSVGTPHQHQLTHLTLH
jgi:hypothetical protein